MLVRLVLKLARKSEYYLQGGIVMTSCTIHVGLRTTVHIYVRMALRKARL